MKSHTGGMMSLGIGGIAQKSTKHKMNKKAQQKQSW